MVRRFKGLLIRKKSSPLIHKGAALLPEHTQHDHVKYSYNYHLQGQNIHNCDNNLKIIAGKSANRLNQAGKYSNFKSVNYYKLRGGVNNGKDVYGNDDEHVYGRHDGQDEQHENVHGNDD
jgi:hypothetical protein